MMPRHLTNSDKETKSIRWHDIIRWLIFVMLIALPRQCPRHQVHGVSLPVADHDDADDHFCVTHIYKYAVYLYSRVVYGEPKTWAYYCPALCIPRSAHIYIVFVSPWFDLGLASLLAYAETVNTLRPPRSVLHPQQKSTSVAVARTALLWRFCCTAQSPVHRKSEKRSLLNRSLHPIITHIV